MSRQVDLNDWGVTVPAFDSFVARWGKPQIDLFADGENAKCAMFIAQRPLPGAAAVDALAVVWPAGIVYACPPWALLGRLLRRLQGDTVEAIVVVPVWPQQAWWPILAPDGIHADARVVDWVPLTRDDFALGISGRPGFLVNHHWKFAALALRWSSSPGPRPVFCLRRFYSRPCVCGL